MEQTIASDIYEPSEKREKLVQMVGFKIGHELFGVDILKVQEIIRSAPITPVPESPEFIEGVINLRGSIVPVIELRKRLNLSSPRLVIPKDKRDNWILILNIEGRVTGFIVDVVTEVLKIDAFAIEPPPEIVVTGLKAQYIQGVCRINESLLILLNFDRILRVEEIKRLKGMDTDG